MKIAFGLRGHIRDGLYDRQLKDYLTKLSNSRRTEIDIYCHTWKENEAKSSYRSLNRDTVFKVTPNLIKNYLGTDLYPNIKNVTISDDSKLKLSGDLDGKVTERSPLIKLPWKRMWAGQYSLMNKIANSGVAYDYVINTRYDIFTNKLCGYSNLSLSRLLQFDGYPLRFLRRDMLGIDNYIIGNVQTMYNLIEDFHLKLDDICSSYTGLKVHEELVYRYAKDKEWCR